jgi:hypothetical protein
MSIAWYCKIMGEQWGPMSTAELIAVARRGRLSRDDVVRTASRDTWIRAEVVDGLFENSPTPTTAAHKPSVQPRVLPARRSVGHKCARKFWVQTDRHMAGPFTVQQLRYLARHGKLKSTYLVSDNHLHWIPASKIRGLCLPAPSATPFNGAAPQPPLVPCDRAT